MTKLGGLPRFTPRLLDHDTLEGLFVHREHLVADAVERIERATRTKERSCRLFVGPRGAGKTHLVSLVYHRAKALPGFGERFQLAWLPEDLWAIGSYDDLLREILKRIEPGSEVSLDLTEPPAGQIARRVAANGPIVVIVENLDTVLEDIGEDGQRKLRAAIESERSLLLVATATRLPDALVDQDEPFYGFFDKVDLEAFDVDQAVSMLQRIASSRGDDALVAELDTPQARARLAAVAHLAGGQPRIWALFGAGLTVEGLDDLVSVLIERFDDLTPYYQEQLRRLSVHERKAVQALAEADRPLPVRALAARTGISERSLGGTLTKLRNAGWIKAREGRLIDLADGRLTYYELAEPLARLAFQLKSSTGEPVRLVVEFLRTWFEPRDLDGIAEATESLSPYLDAVRASWTSDASAAACRLLSSSDVVSERRRFAPDALELMLAVDDGLGAYGHGDPDACWICPVRFPASSTTSSKLARSVNFGSRCLGRVIEAEDMAGWVGNIESAVNGSEADDRDAFLVLRALVHLNVGEAEAAGVITRGVSERWSRARAGNPFVHLAVVRVAATYLAGSEDRAAGVTWLLDLYRSNGPGQVAGLVGIARLSWTADPMQLAAEDWTLGEVGGTAGGHWLMGSTFTGALLGPLVEVTDDLTMVGYLVDLLRAMALGSADATLEYFEALARRTESVHAALGQRGLEAVASLRRQAEAGDWVIPPFSGPALS